MSFVSNRQIHLHQALDVERKQKQQLQHELDSERARSRQLEHDITTRRDANSTQVVAECIGRVAAEQINKRLKEENDQMRVRIAQLERVTAFDDEMIGQYQDSERESFEEIELLKVQINMANDLQAHNEQRLSEEIEQLKGQLTMSDDLQEQND